MDETDVVDDDIQSTKCDPCPFEVGSVACGASTQELLLTEASRCFTAMPDQQGCSRSHPQVLGCRSISETNQIGTDNIVTMAADWWHVTRNCAQ